MQTSSTPVVLDVQTVVSTLVLEAYGSGFSTEFQVTSIQDLGGQMSVVIVPEPGTAALLALGLVALARARRRTRGAPH